MQIFSSRLLFQLWEVWAVLQGTWTDFQVLNLLWIYFWTQRWTVLHTIIMILPSCIWTFNSLTSIVLKGGKKKTVAEKVNASFLFILFLLSLGTCPCRVLQLHPVTIAIPVSSWRFFFNDEIFLPLLSSIFQQLVGFWDPISSQEVELLHKAQWLCYCAWSDWWIHTHKRK